MNRNKVSSAMARLAEGFLAGLVVLAVANISHSGFARAPDGERAPVLASVAR